MLRPGLRFTFREFAIGQWSIVEPHALEDETVEGLIFKSKSECRKWFERRYRRRKYFVRWLDDEEGPEHLTGKIAPR